MASLELPVPLDEILQTKQVEVVQTLDVGSLKTLLKWIVDQLGKQTPSSASGDGDRLAQLENDNAQLRDQLAALQAAQDGLRDELGTKLDKTTFDQSELAGMTSQDLPQRVKALEDKLKNMPGPEPEPAAAAAASSAGDLAPIAAPTVADPAGGAPQLLPSPSQISAVDPTAFEALQHRVDGLEAKLAGLGPSEGAGAAAAAGDTLADLRAQLAGKADAADLDTLKQRLGDKADRSELDALAASGAAAGLGAGAEAAAPITVAADGSLDMPAVADGLNKALGEVASLRALLLMLQERLAGKADIGALDDLSAGLRGLQAAAASQPRGGAGAGAAELGALDNALAELRARLGALELQMAAGLGPAAGGDAHKQDAAVAVDAGGSLEDALAHIQALFDKLGGKADKGALEPLARRLAELGAALAGLEARLGAAEAAAEAAAGDALGRANEGLAAAAAAGTGAGAGAGSGAGGVDPVRVSDMEAALSDLDAAVRALQGGRRGSGTGGTEELGDALAALRDRVSALEMALAGKADLGAIDELKLRVAMGGSGGGDGGDGGSNEGLLEVLQGMLAGKANQAELDALRDVLGRVQAAADNARALAQAAEGAAADAQAAADGAAADAGAGAGGADPAELQQMLSSRATRDEVIALADQVGNLFGELQALRSAVASQPQASGMKDLLSATQQAAAAAQAAAAHGAGGGHSDGGHTAQLVSALAKELQGLRDALDLVAHAANLMAVGPEQARMGPGGAAGAAGAAGANGAAPGLVNGREPRTPRGAVDRLTKLLGRQAVGHKMDWFDPETLNRMATRMGQLDALLKNPGAAGVLTGRAMPDQGMRDLELQVKRLARDLRSVKDARGDGMAGVRMPEGDHAMLSGKPLMGYRCMACDRPLEKLDEKPGPYIPTYQMPVSVAAAPDVNTKASLGRGGAGLSPEHSSVMNSPARPGQPLPRKAAYDPASEKRGPQNWYEDTKGPPAEALPTGDVGPKLPPGGWRGNSTSGAAKMSNAGLPDIGTPSKPRSPAVPNRSPPRSMAGRAGEVEDHAAIQQGMLPSI